MSDITRNVLGVLAIILAVALVALAMTGIAAWDFRADCQSTGGTYSATWSTLNCRY